MSTLLAIESSTSACSVAILHENNVVEDFIIAPQDHTKRLLPMIDQLLASCGLGLKQIDAIAFTAGPGSFTGLRICMGTVQGLAFGGNIPVIPISTLEVMARGALRMLDISPTDLIIPCLDARMSEIYWSIFTPPLSDATSIIRLHEDAISSPQQFCEQHLLPQLTRSPQRDSSRRVIGIGNGWALQEMSSLLADHISEIQSEYYPHAYDVALLAEAYLQNQPAIAIEDAQLTYIRNEVSWTKRKRIR